jgi:hypothetical protein
MNKKLLMVFALFLMCGTPALLLADADDTTTAYAPGSELFKTLNYRSKYYADWFPEPFRVEDTAIDNELRFDWEHDQGRGSVGNTETFEIQKSFNIFTFELQVPYSATTGAIAADGDDAAVSHSSAGFANVELGARLPLFQYVSKTGLIDNSVGFNFEAGIPTNSVLGKNAEISPGLFDDLGIGNRFSVQTLFTFTHTFGTVQTGRASFQYGLAFGYAIEDEDFRIPHVERLIPSVELVGNTALDGANAGHNALTGTAGVRAEFKPIAGLQPSFGVGYIFPIDGGGRDEIRWGGIVSLTLEF